MVGSLVGQDAAGQNVLTSISISLAGASAALGRSVVAAPGVCPGTRPLCPGPSAAGTSCLWWSGPGTGQPTPACFDL